MSAYFLTDHWGYDHIAVWSDTNLIYLFICFALVTCIWSLHDSQNNKDPIFTWICDPKSDTCLIFSCVIRVCTATLRSSNQPVRHGKKEKNWTILPSKLLKYWLWLDNNFKKAPPLESTFTSPESWTRLLRVTLLCPLLSRRDTFRLFAVHIRRSHTCCVNLEIRTTM